MSCFGSDDPRLRGLTWALTDPDLAAFTQDGWVDNDAASAAAFRLAVELGVLRLKGYDLFGTDLDGILPTAIAQAAAAVVVDRAEQLAADVARLADPVVVHDLAEDDRHFACSFFEARYDFWAAAVAVEETHQVDLEEGTCVESFSPLVNKMATALAELDEAMRARLDVLKLAAGTLLLLLQNYRVGLCQEYVEDLPWWLDGTVEKATGWWHFESAGEARRTGSSL